MKKLSTRLTAVAAGVALTALIGCRGETETTTDSGASGNPWNESNITTPGPPGPAIGGDQPTMSGDAAQQDRTVASTDLARADEVTTDRATDSSAADRDTGMRESAAPDPVGVDRDFDSSMRAARQDRN
jgi:hypothetical protein